MSPKLLPMLTATILHKFLTNLYASVISFLTQKDVVMLNHPPYFTICFLTIEVFPKLKNPMKKTEIFEIEEFIIAVLNKILKLKLFRY